MSTTTTFASLPALGAEWPADSESVSIGHFIGLTTSPEGEHFAVVLLSDKPAQDRLTWSEAMAWAESVGGELLNRPEGALAFANAKSHFEPRFYWLREQYSAPIAWGQHFVGGHQYLDGKGFEYRARAVRRFKLSA